MLVQEDFLQILAAQKPTGVFSALARRVRPLADTSPARVVRNAPSSKNPPLIFAQQPRQNPQEILRLQVLRTADKARHGLFTIAPLRGAWLPVFCRPPLYRRRAVGFPALL